MDGDDETAMESKARHVLHKFAPVGPVPDVEGLTEEERAAGAKRYSDHRRSMRVDDPAEMAVGADDDWTFEQLRLSQLMLPSDATESGVVFGGAMLMFPFFSALVVVFGERLQRLQLRWWCFWCS